MGGLNQKRKNLILDFLVVSVKLQNALRMNFKK